MYRISGFLAVLSVGVVFWLAHVLGLLGFTRGSAAEEPAVEVSEPAPVRELQKQLAEKLTSLETKEIELTKRAQALDEREKILLEQVRKYEKALEQMKKAEKNPAAREVASPSEKAEKKESLGAVYEKMDPKKAAKILEGTEIALATSILAAMKPERAAEILGRIPAEKARGITERLAVNPNPIERR